MDEEDFLEIIAEIRRQFEELGIAELGDIENYITEFHAEVDYPDNRKLAIEMLLAFDRFLSVRDRTTYNDAMSRIRENCAGPQYPESAVIFLSERESHMFHVAERQDLSEVKDLSEIRKAMSSLIENLGGMGLIHE